MKLVQFKGEQYREARYLRMETTRTHLCEGLLLVGPTVPDFLEVRAFLYIKRQPHYSGAVWSHEALFGPWAPDLPDESFEAAALLLCASTGFTPGPFQMTTGPWGWPIKETA